VVTAATEFLAPFAIGRDPDNIEDMWQAGSISPRRPASVKVTDSCLGNAASTLRDPEFDQPGQA
jgi:hypothetical protein